jgi:hypothetical protein
MHGIEHCRQKRRTIRHSTPRKLCFYSFRINASWLAAYCLPSGTDRS